MAIYDLIWKEGEDKSGKARWSKVGILMEKGDGKKSVKLTTLPVGNWDGWLVVSERKERDDRTSNRPISSDCGAPPRAFPDGGAPAGIHRQ